MGSASPPVRWLLLKQVSDRIDALLVQAKSSQIPIIDVHLEAERVVEAFPDLQLDHDQIARAIFERSTRISGLGVVTRPPPLDERKGA